MFQVPSRMEKDLDIQKSNYPSIRRLAQDWPRLNKMQKQLVITRMMQFLEQKHYEASYTVTSRDMSRSPRTRSSNAP